MAVSDRALLCSLVSQSCAPPHKLWLFIYHCAAFLSPFLCVFLCCCHLCHSNGGNFNWDINRQQQSSEPLWGGSQHLRCLQGEICKEWQGGCQARESLQARAGRVTVASEEQEREEEGACHLSLQDSCKALIMCVLFIPCLCSLTISWETFQRKGGEE